MCHRDDLAEGVACHGLTLERFGELPVAKWRRSGSRDEAAAVDH
jgi:hypothetical protein